jgi:hypothetical protein
VSDACAAGPRSPRTGQCSRRRLALSSVALACAILASPRGAAASDAFSPALADALALSYVPGCDVCHASGAAPVGAADRPFSAALVARGLVAGDVASLVAALDALGADAVDSDGDGSLDVDELAWGADPNRAEVPEGGDVEPPTYGCAATGGDARPRSEAALALVLVGVGWRLARWRLRARAARL